MSQILLQSLPLAQNYLAGVAVCPGYAKLLESVQCLGTKYPTRSAEQEDVSYRICTGIVFGCLAKNVLLDC